MSQPSGRFRQFDKREFEVTPQSGKVPPHPVQQVQIAAKVLSPTYWSAVYGKRVLLKNPEMREDKSDEAIRIRQPGLLLAAGMLVGKSSRVLAMEEQWLLDPVIVTV